jgi:ABC-type dipeptide/oligopeptide/nickel transport system permease subunit
MSAAPLVMLGPGLAVVISVLIINLFGDWLRDRLALDETRAA